MIKIQCTENGNDITIISFIQWNPDYWNLQGEQELVVFRCRFLSSDYPGFSLVREKLAKSKIAIPRLYLTLIEHERNYLSVVPK